LLTEAGQLTFFTYFPKRCRRNQYAAQTYRLCSYTILAMQRLFSSSKTILFDSCFRLIKFLAKKCFFHNCRSKWCAALITV